MFMSFENLWLCRCIPEENRRIDEFIKDGVIGIGWTKLGDMSHKSKSLIRDEINQVGYGTSNVTVGVFNHFVNNMQIGDICLIPDENKIYIAKIEGNYFYDKTKLVLKFPHIRKVTFLNADKPLDRYDLPEDLQKSLGARNTVADLTHRKDLFINYMNNVIDDTIGNTISDKNNMQNELLSMLPKALQNIKNDLESDDATRREIASIEVIKLIQSFQE